MKKYVSSILKLVLSISFGIFLIWYFWNQLSKPIDIPVSEKAGFSGTYQVAEIRVEDSAYIMVGDTLMSLQKETGAEEHFISEKEGYFTPAVVTGDQVETGGIVGTVVVDVWGIMLSVFDRINYLWIILPLFLSLMSHLSRAIRWKMLLQPLGYNPKLSNAFFAVMIMYIANLAFPRAGEVLRCVMLQRYEGIPIQKSLGTMITERAIDLLLLIVTLVMIFVLEGDVFMQSIESFIAPMLGGSSASDHTFKLIVLGVLAVLGIVFYLLYKSGKLNFMQKIFQLFKEMGEGVKSIRNVEKPFWFVFHSILVWALYFFVIMGSFYVLEETSHFGFVPALMVLVFGSIGIIAVQGGLGAYPLIISKVLAIYGLAETIGYAFGWVIWSGQTILILVVGLISLVLINVLNTRKIAEEPIDVGTVQNN